MVHPKPFQVISAGDALEGGPRPQPVVLYGLEEYIQSLVGYGSEPYGGDA